MTTGGRKTGESKRKQARYAVSEDCRLRAAILLRSSDAGTAGKDWPGTLVDLSMTGAHIQISMAAVAYEGDGCVLKLSHGGRKLELRGFLAHYICAARHSVCGVRFDLGFGGAEKALEPFLKAIMASATLKPGETGAEADRYREEYNGPGNTKLVVWRDNKPERAVVAFEYVMGHYTATLNGAGPDMFRNKEQVVFRDGPAGGSLSSEQVADARWEFSLAASNLPATIPPELRRFLRLVS